MSFEIGYFVVSVLFLAVWAVLFVRYRWLRGPMLALSLITMLAGPVSEYWYFQDYWRPPTLLSLPIIGGVEDLLFGFAIGGIAGFAYEALFVKRWCLCDRDRLAHPEIILIFPAAILGSMLVLNGLLGINSIFASIAGMVAAGVSMLVVRRALWRNALVSGLLVAGTMFVLYLVPQLLFPQAHVFLDKAWLLNDTRFGGLIFGHVPVTEMIWGLAWGFAFGPFYVYLTGAHEITGRGREQHEHPAALATEPPVSSPSASR